MRTNKMTHAEMLSRRLFTACAALIAGISASSVAVSADYTETYANVGNWQIMASSEGFDACAADTSNSQVTFRLEYHAEVGYFFLAQPYYDNSGIISAGFGFGNRVNETISFDSGALDGWATAQLDDSFLNELRMASAVTIDLDRGPQTFSMVGSSAAIDKLIECGNNGGRVSFAAPPPQQPMQTSAAGTTWHFAGEWDFTASWRQDMSVLGGPAARHAELELNPDGTGLYCGNLGCEAIKVTDHGDFLSFDRPGFYYEFYINNESGTLDGSYWSASNKGGDPDGIVQMFPQP